MPNFSDLILSLFEYKVILLEQHNSARAKIAETKEKLKDTTLTKDQLNALKDTIDREVEKLNVLGNELEKLAGKIKEEVLATKQ